MSEFEEHRRWLLNGYAAFRTTDYRRQRERYERLAIDGQRPKLMVIACSDSRVDPATVFNTAPGEMFVLRHVAALVPPCERDGRHHSASAAIEFAVTQLEVDHIMVFGHGGCGGISASLSRCFDDCQEGEGGFVHHWMEIIAPARDVILQRMVNDEPRQQQLALELESIRVSLNRLRDFPGVAERLDQGRLHLHGAHFDVRSGTLRMLDADGLHFRRIGLEDPVQPAV